MINKIKDRINSYVDGKLKKLFKKHRGISQIQFNDSQLKQLFTDTSFYLPLTTWSMSPSTMVHVLNDVVVNDRTSIVEFGSGASTLYVAKLLKSHAIKATFYSVESNLEWANKLTKQLELLDLTAYASIIHAPIQPINGQFALGEQKLWYDVNVLNEAFKAIDAFDLVLVDGPFGGLTPHARYSAIPYLKNRLTTNCSVFLDDIDREEEKNILKSWEVSLNCHAQIIERYAILSPNEQFYSKPFQL